jgi:hypothetical protein
VSARKEKRDANMDSDAWQRYDFEEAIGELSDRKT